VFYPSAKAGYRLRVSGVADNFQLHTLLADALLQRRSSSFLSRFRRSEIRLPETPPDPLVAAVARGDGPQTSDISSRGVWNLHNWTALEPDGTLPSAVPTKHWIWGEGIPAGILSFEGKRVVLLAPASYARGWNTGRYFSALRASVVIEESLSPSATEFWLRRMGEASQSS
jgi:hypothetical protein